MLEQGEPRLQQDSGYRREETETQGKCHVMTEGDWSDVAANQGMPMTDDYHQKRGETMKESPSETSERVWHC